MCLIRKGSKPEISIANDSQTEVGVQVLFDELMDKLSRSNQHDVAYELGDEIITYFKGYFKKSYSEE